MAGPGRGGRNPLQQPVQIGTLPRGSSQDMALIMHFSEGVPLPSDPCACNNVRR